VFRTALTRRNINVSKSGPLNDLYWRITPTYTTDSEFKHDGRSLVFALQPTAKALGIGAANSIGPFEYQWTPIAKLEYGKIFDDGNGVESDAPYGRAGLHMDLEMYLRGAKNALLFAKCAIYKR